MAERVRDSQFISLPDPFDRVLIAQAQTEGMTLLTRDRWIPQYDVQVMPV